MFKIYNISFNYNTNVFVGLTKIFGIGISRSLQICKNCNIHFHKKFKDISNLDFNNIKIQLSKFVLENELKKKIFLYNKRLISSKCYRGLRHLKKLPSRGQRTRTNARTAKGPKKKIFIKKRYEKKVFKKKK